MTSCALCLSADASTNYQPANKMRKHVYMETEIDVDPTRLTFPLCDSCKTRFEELWEGYCNAASPSTHCYFLEKWRTTTGNLNRNIVEYASE